MKIRINKYLLIFTGIFLFLGLSVFIILQKYLPLLFQHIVYYCQSLGHSLSMRIPHQLGNFLLLGVSAFALLVFLRLMFSYFKIYFQRKRLHRKLVKNSAFEVLVKRLDLTDKAFLVENHKPFAFCHGIRRPKIYVSSRLVQLLTLLELEAVLRHERYHLEKRDSVTLLTATLVQSIFPFFPLIADIIYNYRVSREIEADSEAVKGLGDTKPLITVLRKFLNHEQISSYAFAPAIAAHDTLEARIQALVTKKIPGQSFSLRNIVVSIVSVFILFGLLTLPVQAVSMAESESEVMMVCLQHDSCSMWCKENSTVAPYVKYPIP